MKARKCGSCRYGCVVVRRKRLLCEWFMVWTGAQSKECAHYLRIDDRPDRLLVLQQEHWAS